MGTKLHDIRLNAERPIRIKKWKIKEGMPICVRQLIMLYELVYESKNPQLLKYKVNDVGTVKKICVAENEIVRPGEVLLQLEECCHPTVMRDMCADCGADLRQGEVGKLNASVPMVHSIPELKVSEELAQILGKADELRLLKDRKLVLLVDLDQTLIHTTNDNIPPNLKDVVHFQLYGSQSQWYHTRIRPGTDKFLNNISEFFELHICTFGARNYAHCIAMFLDPDGRFFSHRILSRDECFDANSKTANLKALFPCGDSMVCIIDDREDVWNYAPNLIHVKPYHFFQHTGDINAPPGLTKKENDTVEEGFDFTQIGEQKAKDDVEKKVTNKKKSSPSGETTTDKDTEDEREVKSAKASVKADMSSNFSDISQLNDTLDNSIQQRDCTNEEPALEKNKPSEETPIEVKKCPEQSMPSIDSETSIFPDSDDGSQEAKNSEVEANKPKVVIEPDGGSETASTTPAPVEKEEELSPSAEDSVRKEGESSTNIDGTEEKEKNPSTSTNNFEEQKTSEETKPKETETLIEVEDTDDYLLFLEDILKKVHKTYYDEYDKISGSNGPLPDLKVVIPSVKKQVLEGCHLVFSGLVPSHVPLNRSRAYAVAVSLGATVSAEVSSSTTHLVAARAGTAKVNSSRRQKGVHVVTPHWLWHCAERWEKVDERLYPLARGVVTNRHPPAHCGSPQHPGDLENTTPAPRTRTDSGRFSDTINPLLTFSSEEMARMDQEVEDLCADDDDDSESETDLKTFVKSPVLPIIDEDDESSSCDSLTGGSPKGWTEDCQKTKKRKKMETTTCTESDLEDDSPSVKFRRGEPLPSDLDLGDDSQDDTQDSQDADGDDSAWNLMGAALEREFLSGD